MRLLLIMMALVASFSGCTAEPVTDVGRTVIAEDQFYQSGYQADGPAKLTINVNVHSGPNIDVFVMDTINMQQFENGNAFVHYSACGGVAASAFHRTCEIDAGEFWIVLDNSDMGDTSPPFNAVDDGADVSWDLRVELI